MKTKERAMTQTKSDKLRVIADAIDAGETHLAIVAPGADRCVIDYAIEQIQWLPSISRIPAQITVGKRVINAPLRVMPKSGDNYYCVDADGFPSAETWHTNKAHERLFYNANCWATEADAKDYAEASLAVRRGEV